jgi:Holliday junction resolvasome RuvABC DNA-binding subunit
MVLELRDKLGDLGLGAPMSAKPAAESLNALEEDVLSALVNLGCARQAAEAAVRKAKAAGVAAEFEPMFRRSLELVR